MPKKPIIVFFLLFLPFVQYACEVFSIDMEVNPVDSFSVSNQSYEVEIKVMLDDSCLFSSQNHRFFVWTYSGEKVSALAQIQSSRPVEVSSLGCISTSQIIDTTLREYTLTGIFSLIDSRSPHILVYFEYGSQQYQNVEGYDTISVPVSAWVNLYGQYFDTNYYPTPYITNPHSKDPNSNFFSGCVGKPKSFSPFTVDPDKDSLGFAVSKVTWFDTSATNYPSPLRKDFIGYYGKSYPIPVDSFAIRKYRSLDFTPTASGFYTLPVIVKELRPEQVGLAAWYTLSTTYRQMPVLFSNQCSPPQTEAFARDTISIDCRQAKVYLPLQDLASSKSISPDGSDLKFHNSNGYPALITAARAQDLHASYTDSLEIDITFLYDGFYGVQLLQGADGNRLIDDCGYEMNGNHRITLQVQNCGQVGLSEESSKTQVDVYPNPARHHLNFVSSTSDLTEIKIFDLTGHQILTQQCEGSEVSISLSNQLSGLYIFEIRLSDGSVLHKIVMVKN